MDVQTIKSVIKTPFFKTILFLIGIYGIGFLIYLFLVEPYVHGIVRDIFHTIYWRWYLDWSAISGFSILYILIGLLFDLLGTKMKARFITIYILPVIFMIANFFGMIALDIAVTRFADVHIGDNWETPTIAWLGMSSQQIYHGFFFWFMPALLITGYPLIRLFGGANKNRWLNSFKIFLFMMGLYELSLGYLDAIVCQVIWGDWSIYGEWSMLGTGGISALGWIIHYTLNAIFLWFGILAVEMMYKQIVFNSP